MGMTMTQKILAAHAGLPSVEVGQLIEAKLDFVHGNDVTTPVAVGVLEQYGITQIFDKDKIGIILDHYTPCKDIKAAQLCKTARDFAHKHQITHFYDVGVVGVEHAFIPEKGLVIPGDLTIGADSHTCTYGALGGVLHRSGFHRYGGWHGHWTELVQSALCHSGQYSRQIQTFCLRQRCDSPFDRQDWGGRSPL